MRIDAVRYTPNVDRSYEGRLAVSGHAVRIAAQDFDRLSNVGRNWPHAWVALPEPVNVTDQSYTGPY
jgi:hypothetical protein